MSSPQWKAPLHGWLMFKHATVEAWDWVQPVLLKVLMERAEFTHSTRSPSSSLAGSFATSRQGHQEQVLSVLQLTLIFTIPCQENQLWKNSGISIFSVVCTAKMTCPPCTQMTKPLSLPLGANWRHSVGVWRGEAECWILMYIILSALISQQHCTWPLTFIYF